MPFLIKQGKQWTIEFINGKNARSHPVQEPDTGTLHWSTRGIPPSLKRLSTKFGLFREDRNSRKNNSGSGINLQIFAQSEIHNEAFFGKEIGWSINSR